MKTFTKLLFAALFFGPAALWAGSGVWTTSGPQYNGLNVGIYAFAPDPAAPATVFSSGYRVWKTTDSGASWAYSDTGITNSTVESLARDPANSQTLYAGSYGVFKSTDGGANWTEVSNGFGYSKNFVRSLAVDPVTPTTVYAGVNSGIGVWKSTDGGANWVDSNNGLIPAAITALAIDPRAHQTVYAATELNGLWKTTNGGQSWSSAGLASEGVYAVAIDPANSSTLYAAGQPSLRATDGIYGVFKSTDGGASWTTIKTGLPTSVDGRGIAIDSSSGAIYLATYGSGVYRSTDGGASWTAFNNGLTDASVSISARNMRAIAVASGVVYAGGDFGVYSYSAGSGQGGHSITGSSSGGNDYLYLHAQIHVAASDAGRYGNYYVAAMLPGGSWYLHNGAVWVPWSGGALPVYSSGSLADTTIPVLTGMDVRSLAGTSVVVGYGLSDSDMLSNQKYTVIYTIQ